MIFETKEQLQKYDNKKNSSRRKYLDGEIINLDDGKNIKLGVYIDAD